MSRSANFASRKRRTPLAYLLSVPVWIYRIITIPFFHGHCRFEPTCSAYALEALQRHGGIEGSWLTLRRLCRCHPWGPHGVDNVPD